MVGDKCRQCRAAGFVIGIELCNGIDIALRCASDGIFQIKCKGCTARRCSGKSLWVGRRFANHEALWILHDGLANFVHHRVIFWLTLPRAGPVFHQIPDCIKAKSIDPFVQPKPHVVVMEVFYIFLLPIEVRHAGGEPCEVIAIAPTAGVPRVFSVDAPTRRCWVLPHKVVALCMGA